MGREIRRVPPNWEHPQRDPSKNPYRHEGLQPMRDRRFDEAFSEWLEDFDRVRAGNLSDFERECYPRGLADWLHDEGAPPDPDYYRPWADEEATWYQVWENVSEGTPVTPPFATKEELVDYLVEHGDFWQHDAIKRGWERKRPGYPGYSRKAAEAFVRDGYAPSMVTISDQSGTKILSGIEAASETPT